MIHLTQMLARFTYKIDVEVRRVVQRYPWSAFLIMLIGVPIFLVAAVTFATGVIMLPVSLLLGWR